MNQLPPTLEDRCTGCLLGTACGDILGSGFEGMAGATIRETFGEIRDFTEARGYGRYTDDTQMTLALATSLVEHGRVDAAAVSAKYAEFYEAWRGYGPAAHLVMQRLQEGADYRKTGRMEFPEGSFGNGGAMRIAPVGLAYRYASPDVLHRAVEDALRCTHVHPEAVDGAFVQATAVAALSRTDPAEFDPQHLLRRLHDASRTTLLQEKLETLSSGLRNHASDQRVIARVGNGIRTSQAVAAALWALLRYGTDPETCIIRAVGFGSDTDTIGAMAGALAGALHGVSGLPTRWYDNIENGSHGRDEMIEVAKRLAAPKCTTEV